MDAVAEGAFVMGFYFRNPIEERGVAGITGNCAADLRLCFRICKKPFFSQRRSYTLLKCDASFGCPSRIHSRTNVAPSLHLKLAGDKCASYTSKLFIYTTQNLISITIMISIGFTTLSLPLCHSITFDVFLRNLQW